MNHCHWLSVRCGHHINLFIIFRKCLFQNNHSKYTGTCRYVSGTDCHTVGRCHSSACISFRRTKRNTCFQTTGRIQPCRTCFRKNACLFARYQYRKWSHLLILTGGWNDASLTRTVDYGTGSYQARGNTTGAGFGAMYELAYDIALNEDRSVILQPLFNASIVTTRMDGYRESGSAGNAGLKVEDQELTTAAVAVGARLSGLMGSNVFGREALGEVRVNVSQDMGDRRGQANVGFLADPSYTRPVYGAKVGSTAFQIGAGLSVPVGTQGVIFVDGNADIRSGSSSINGSIGYRYNF